ncbi:MAG: site-specific integrase [Clostridia bacterium]|nr:site-specific integrase [Clostridia bacterium]
MKYENWLNQWLENYVKPQSKQKTYHRYTEIVNQHIRDRLGGYELDDLTPLVLQQFTTELLNCGNLKTGRGLSANSVNVIVTVIQNSLKSAFMVEQVSEYRADRIKRPKVREKQVTCFTPVEQKRIEQAVLKGNLRRMFGVILCMYSGIRIGELLALTWSDIDFKRGTVSITKTRHDGVDGAGRFTHIITAPKTSSSVREIPLPRQLLPMLRELKKVSNSRFIVATATGTAVSVRSYQRSFEMLLRKLNIPHKGFHSLRHTFATRALECGMDVKTLSEILGHKSASVTLSRYVHSMNDHKKAMMNKVGRLL